MTHLGPELWRRKRARQREKYFQTAGPSPKKPEKEELSNVVTFYSNCIRSLVRLSLYTFRRSQRHLHGRPCISLFPLPLIKSGVYSRKLRTEKYLRPRGSHCFQCEQTRRWISTYQPKKKNFDSTAPLVRFVSKLLPSKFGWESFRFLMMKTKLKKLFWPDVFSLNLINFLRETIVR